MNAFGKMPGAAEGLSRGHAPRQERGRRMNVAGKNLGFGEGFVRGLDSELSEAHSAMKGSER